MRSSTLNPLLSFANLLRILPVILTICGSAQSASPAPSLDIAAIYFPGYHHDAHYDAWFGEAWNEWRLLDHAQPRFPGQHFFRPAWGNFDEADPRWMARQIDLAADHGITVFIFDWYWYSGVQILQRPLEQGFLHAHNRARLKYALMWANHDWRNYFPAPLDKDAMPWLPTRATPADFQRLTAHCIDRHFGQTNYWRIGGKAYFGIFDVAGFMRQLGGPGRTAEVLRNAREQSTAAGLGGIHFAAFATEPHAIPDLVAAGFDSITAYNICCSPEARLPERPLDDYARLSEHHLRVWKSMDTGALPFCPIVTAGWDPSPRWVDNTPFPPPPGRGYPYTPVVTNNTPDKFGELCQRALLQAKASKIPPPAIVINAWNEWTEGSALLPDRQYGTQFLEALAAALRTGSRAAAQ